jgi:hypothetical protein
VRTFLEFALFVLLGARCPSDRERGAKQGGGNNPDREVHARSAMAANET